MKTRYLAAATLSLAALTPQWQPLLAQSNGNQAEARQVLDRAIEALGGDKLRNLRVVRVSGIGYSNALEQSERPEGPWIKIFQEFTETRHHGTGAYARESRSRSSIWSPEWTPTTTTVVADGAALISRGDRTMPGRASMVEGAEESLDLSPERILFTARDGNHLRMAPDTVLAGVRNHRVRFVYKGSTIDVLIDANTSVPSGYIRTGVSERAYDWIWGDTKRAVYYSIWWLEENGVRFPTKIVEEINGQTLSEWEIASREFDPEIEPEELQISPEIKTAFQAAASQSFPVMRTIALGADFRGQVQETIEPADGIVIYPGTWNVALVRQPEGVFVIEAPISSPYSEQVIAAAGERFPGQPITGVVSTSDAWPHISGIREYAAQRVPLYILDQNLPIIGRLLEAPYETHADNWSRANFSPSIQAVDHPVEIGTGPNRLVLYPIRGDGAERMIMVYFPEKRLLYGSDLIQRNPNGSFFAPVYLLELAKSVERYGLEVDTVWAMHTPPMPWEDVLAVIDEY